MSSPTSGEPDGPIGKTITAPDGQQYFLYGKNRIKITEHFPANGKQIDILLEELIVLKSKENSQKIA